MSETLARMPTTIAPSDLPAPHDPDLPYAISMVCTGNICRSAMAERQMLPVQTMEIA